MRRHGASHSSKRARVDVPSKTYPAARRKLNEILKAFCFVKVSEVTNKPAVHGKPEFYHGVGTTQSNSKFESFSERAFFDKGGRLRYNSTFDIGPCKLLDAAWGRDHPSALPQIGDILIGVLENNCGGHGEKSKSRIPKVLRSWSRHGKIIMELSRMVEYGTSISEFDSRSILRQNECAMVDQALAASSLGVNISSVRTGASSADDFWMLARLILWGNVRPLVVLHSIETGCKCKTEPSSAEKIASSELKLSCSAYDFLSGLAFKLEDSELMKDFTDSLDIVASMPLAETTIPPLPPPPSFSHFGYGYGVQIHCQPQDPPQASVAPYMGNVTPPYAPSSPTYMPKSPSYAPSSPVYAPSSPIASSSPRVTSTPPSNLGYAPSFPVDSSPRRTLRPTNPPSPVYRPSSPSMPPKAEEPLPPAENAFAEKPIENLETLIEDTFVVSYKDI